MIKKKNKKLTKVEPKTGKKLVKTTKKKINPKCSSFEGYMCSTDFFYEQGRPIRGNVFFANLKDLKEVQKCVLPGKDSCGIVKVKVEFVKWIKKDSC